MPSFPKRDELIQALEALRGQLPEAVVDDLIAKANLACDEAWDVAFSSLETE